MPGVATTLPQDVLTAFQSEGINATRNVPVQQRHGTTIALNLESELPLKGDGQLQGFYGVPTSVKPRHEDVLVYQNPDMDRELPMIGKQSHPAIHLDTARSFLDEPTPTTCMREPT